MHAALIAASFLSLALFVFALPSPPQEDEREPEPEVLDGKQAEDYRLAA